MKGDPEERAAAVGRYIVESGATVRAAAAVFGVSKSTIWKDQHRLRRIQHLARRTAAQYNRVKK